MSRVETFDKVIELPVDAFVALLRAGRFGNAPDLRTRFRFAHLGNDRKGFALDSMDENGKITSFAFVPIVNESA